jgi:class 3 adenylate cyclase
MKRITYISRLHNALSASAIEELGVRASRYNLKQDITGVLMYFSGLFFQIIEGDDTKIDRLFVQIKRDPRHTDVLCLKTEYQVEERLFPNWSMRVINLDHNTDSLIHPVKILLQTISESHGIIAQYTQPAVFNMLDNGINPLKVPAQKVEKIVLFGDIVSFSAISENLPVEMIARMINRYLEICCDEISVAGGEVTKFMGDGVMAYFAPGLADNAVEACLNILSKVQDLRQSADIRSPLRLMYCGFGLSRGVVIEGNMGSAIKKDYTILGDPVNTAKRLEALTRDVHKAIVLSEQVKNSTQRSWDYVSLGKHDLKGKARMTELYFPDHDLVIDFDLRDTIINGLKELHKE